MPKSRVRLSAGRTELFARSAAALFPRRCQLDFYGDKLLTTGNPDCDDDRSDAQGCWSSCRAARRCVDLMVVSSLRLALGRSVRKGSGQPETICLRFPDAPPQSELFGELPHWHKPNPLTPAPTEFPRSRFRSFPASMPTNCGLPTEAGTFKAAIRAPAVVTAIATMCSSSGTPEPILHAPVAPWVLVSRRQPDDSSRAASQRRTICPCGCVPRNRRRFFRCSRWAKKTNIFSPRSAGSYGGAGRAVLVRFAVGTACGWPQRRSILCRAAATRHPIVVARFRPLFGVCRSVPTW